MKRGLVVLLSKLDEGLDEVLYRPAVVKAFRWLPRWWMCDLAQLSQYLDDRWKTGYWKDHWLVPRGRCEACGRRAAWLMIGGTDDLDVEHLTAEELEVLGRPVYLCGWCQVRGFTENEEQLQAAMQEAAAESIAWRWRWTVRP